MAHLITFLWFDGNLAEALDFYAGTFPSFVLHSSNSDDNSGLVVSAEFSILGYELMAMGWPREAQFTSATSLFVSVDSQAEVDELWEALTAEGEPGQCGWCTDKFGVSWQIIPTQFGEHVGNPDPVKAAFAWNALRSMSKIVIAELSERPA
jgi:predicted 3-demethylubiquinone-9 3-methyltransferase (glyoxalase superfamily)